MPLWKNTQHAFISGQLDANVMGRQDMDRYFKGATLLKNFLVKRQGCISKRRGTDLTADLDGLLGTTYDGTPITPGKMRLVPVTNGDDGRYVIFSGGIGFVASREGIMTADNRHVRKVQPYVALDEDGKAAGVAGKDVRQSVETPVDVIHRIGPGNYVVTRYANTLDGNGNVTSSALQNAFNAAADGDIVRLHSNLLLTSAVTVTSSGTWTTDANAAATVTWNADATNHLRQYKIVTGGQTYWSRETDYYGNRSTLTFEGSNSETVTVTEAAKSVTLDLYGYKITINSNAGGIFIKRASVTLAVDSTRNGAKIALTGTGGARNVFCIESSCTRVPGGSLVLRGDIAYDLYSSGAGYSIVDARDATDVQIDAGTFTNHGESTSFVTIDGGPLRVNGGTFTNELDGNFYVYTFRGVHSTGRSQATTITINGGSFKNLNTQFNPSFTEYGGYVICNSGATVVINGGRFTVASTRSLVSRSDYRGHTFWSNGFLRIVRGEFSQNAIDCPYDSWIAHPLTDYAEDGSVANETRPNADGYYGIKLAGEGDYRWDGTSRSTAPYRFAIPYADKDLADLCIRQSGDTLFVAHRDYPPAKIYFDKHGNAYFEELTLDNTDYNPPVIESAEMVGQDPVETDWPTGFDSTLKADAKSKGTVTDAGMNSNSSSGSDGSSQSATTWQATAESKDRTSGKKTVTVIVKSSTRSVAIEKNRVYQNGLVVAENDVAITTTGTAQNEASATSVIVSRTVRYVATYVKDGHESRPSAPVAVDYDMPWANNAVVNLAISKGANDEEPDYYNVYKDNGNGYGLIATTNVDMVAGGTFGALDTYPLFTPDNTLDTAKLVCMADLEEKKGWPVGDVMRKLVSTGRDAFTSSPANDLCLLSTAANASNGINLDFGSAGARFSRIGVMLDGRIYDKERDASYVIISTNQVTCTVTYKKTDGTTATASKTMTSPQHYSWGGISGGMMGGIYEDWVSLQRRAFTAPNGDTVYGWLYGKGDCADDFNAHLRRLVFNLADFTYASGQSFNSIASITAVKFTFSESVYSYWTNNPQGCIHAIHFYSGTSTASGGNVQDDYINPDMTVTPPDDTQDAHFSAADEYPGCVGIYEQRLVFASTRNSPSTIWMSRIADLYNFTVHDSIREDDALELTLAATEFPNINHLVMGRDLMLFGDGGEWLISPVQGNALTYKTASAKLQSMIGSDRALQPLQLADETLFAERGGTCLRTINYNYASDSYQSQDLSVIAQSLFRANPIISMAYKQHPDSIVECVLADGRVATLVYMKEQDVAAWSVQELGGGWKAREIVSPKCIVHGTTEMMLLVEKNGAFQLWKVRDDDDELSAASQVTLDAIHVEDAGDPGAGEIAVSLGDGTYAVGYPVESEFVSIRPEPEKGQTAQMEIKNSTETEIRVTDATTFSVKPFDASSGWRDVLLPIVRDGASVALASKDCKRLMTGINSRDGRIHLKHTEPWPLTILSISTTYQVEYENGTGGDGQ